MKYLLRTIAVLVCLWAVSFIVWFTLASRAANYYKISSINYKMASMFIGVDNAKSKKYEKEAIESRNTAASAEKNAEKLLTVIKFCSK